MLHLTTGRATAPPGALLACLGSVACFSVGVLHLDHLPMSLCVFKAVTGLPCLTCGSTRALGRLFALDPAGALSMNPLVTLCVVALLPWGAADLLLASRGRSLALDLSPGGRTALAVMAAVALVANWAYLLAAGR